MARRDGLDRRILLLIAALTGWAGGLVLLAGPVDLLQPPATAADPPVATQPAGPASAVRFAALLPLSGDLAPLGRSARQGLELAAETVNRAGGVAGRPIQLVFMDTQSRAALADGLATRAIVLEQAEALIGGLHGPTALAIRPLAEKRKTLFVVLSGAYRFPADASRYSCRVSLSDSQLTDALAGFARQTLRAERGLVVSDVTADQASLLADRFADQFVRLGGQLAGIESVRPGREPPAALIGKIEQARPDLLFFSAGGDFVAGLAPALRKARLETPILAAAPSWSLPALLTAEAAAVRPAYVAVPFAPDDPDARVRRFLDDFARAHRGSTPDGVAVTAHDGLLLLAEAAARHARLGGELRDHLLTLRDLPTVMGPTGFDDDGQIVKPVAICRLTAATDPPGASRLVFQQRVSTRPAKPATVVEPPPPATQPTTDQQPGRIGPR